MHPLWSFRLFLNEITEWKFVLQIGLLSGSRRSFIVMCKWCCWLTLFLTIFKSAFVCSWSTVLHILNHRPRLVDDLRDSLNINCKSVHAHAELENNIRGFSLKRCCVHVCEMPGVILKVRYCSTCARILNRTRRAPLPKTAPATPKWHRCQR